MIAAPVHPHWRGEHAAPCLGVIAGIGSSPLAWGTFARIWLVVEVWRFIPTGVGNISSTGECGWQCPVHPHWRGEHLLMKLTVDSGAGSSPLAWGTSLWSGGNEFMERFIPTGVGNIQNHSHIVWLRPVHPHWRGEHIPRISSRNRAGGSSPLAWGTSQLNTWILRHWRFIPTGVGNIP